MSQIVCRGIRGAITVEANEADLILDATRELLGRLVEANQIAPDDIASVIFSSTSDLNATFPALAARQFGWTGVALLGCQEVAVAGALPRCIRVLIHWNTDRRPDDLKHIYLREATVLRPDRNL
ncbi:MAG TPA: chorismate mutase, partial [Ardenticatenaceae bacterium]|nr:chorismate mutase [Ardenticatenaceae bacterium]